MNSIEIIYGTKLNKEKPSFVRCRTKLDKPKRGIKIRYQLRNFSIEIRYGTKLHRTLGEEVRYGTKLDRNLSVGKRYGKKLDKT